MTLRELRYLVALADQEHFGRAAEECCVSQSTLSTQIKKLEGYLGVSLIERNAGSFSLTPVGQDIVAKARRIVRQVDDLQITARTALGPLVGPLRLGVIPTLAPYYLPSFVPLVKGQYQRLQLVFHEDLTQHLVERLRNYEIDAALLALPLDGEDFEELPLFDEPFWLACPPGHSLADSKTITQADLRGVPLLLLADGRWPPAADLVTRTSRRCSMTFERSVWRPSASSSHQVSAAHYCRRWPRFRRNVRRHHSSCGRCILQTTAAALDSCGVEAIRRRRSWHCSVI